jgi:DNA-binding NtrC family response regulator
MDTAKILVVANAPGILQRVEETLAGLEMQVAIRLRDASAAAREGGFSVLVLYLGFEPQSTVELVASISDELPAIVCLAPQAAGSLEAQLRAVGAAEVINLIDYPRTPQGNEVLRKRILSASTRMRATPVTRVLLRASRAAGGLAKLAAHLDVPEEELLAWMRGEVEAPERVFLAAFDLVLTDIERGSRKPS